MVSKATAGEGLVALRGIKWGIGTSHCQLDKAGVLSPKSGKGVSEDDGTRFSWGRAKREAIAPPRRARGPPTTLNNTRSPEKTRDLTVSPNPPKTRDPQTSLQLAFFVTHPPPERPHCQPGTYGCQPSLATRAATALPTPPSVEPDNSKPTRKQEIQWVFVRQCRS